MKRTNLTRVQNKDNGNLICVKEDFDNGVSLVYTEIKNHIFVKPLKNKGKDYFSEDEQKEIDDYLREDKGFSRQPYFKNELMGSYWLCKFKELDRTLSDIADIVFDEKNVEQATIDLNEEYPNTSTNNYDIVKDFLTYIYGEDDNEDIKIEENRLDIVSMSIDKDTWNRFCGRYNYGFTSNHGCVNLSIWFNENDEIREIHYLLKDNAIKNIDNVELTTAESCREYIDVKKRRINNGKI